ncbi:MAG: purine-nucleoside phosphorylase [Candidatus Omnitrophica bacterium]|nr:purine-nucleoside phosphorylase [Candidatus Omnitrophota bacterium]
MTPPATAADLHSQIQESAEFIRKKITQPPQVAVILGTGLGRVGEHLSDIQRVAYSEIPHFPVSTVESHRGELVVGTLGGKVVAAMEGRFHFYEGYTMRQVTYPVRVLKALGAKVLMVSNACGGMNPSYEPGDLMIIADHINLMPGNPLIGPNDDRLGIRFPDMSAPYDPELIRLASQIAQEQKIRAHQGVYVAVAGPNLETRAEYKFLRAIGSDVVGMSTVPEVLAGVHAGMRVFGLSCVTDKCIPETLKATTVEEVIRVAMGAEPKITQLMTQMIERMKIQDG